MEVYMKLPEIMTDPATDSPEKQKVAFTTIGLSAAAVLLGIAVRTPIFGTFSLGAWIGFISFLLSLGAVNNHGKNIMAKIAFWISFVAMTLSIFLSAAA